MSQALVTWYGHSCFRIELAGSSIVLDPYAAGSVPGLRLPDLTADAVHISHSHSDHSASEYVLRSGRSVHFTLREVVGTHGQGVCPGQGDNTILVIEGDGLRIVHMGDQGCALTPAQVEQIGRPDLLLIPVGGFCTVDAAGAHEIMEQLQSTVTVPMHFRDGGVGFQALSTLDPFLTGPLPVVHARQRRFAVTAGMPRQILLPQLVQ